LTGCPIAQNRRLKAYVLDIRYEFAFKSDMTELVLKALIDEGIIDRKDYE